MPIPPPNAVSGHPDRRIECEFALEPALQQLVQEAQAAGWSETEVVTALLSLGLARVQQRFERLTAAATAALARRPAGPRKS